MGGKRVLKRIGKRMPAAALLLAGGMAALGGGMLQAQESGQTVWNGVYTEAQAARGAAAYSQNCAACHGVSLAGTGEAPGLAGGEFLSNWNGLSVGELFDRIRTTMPFDRPGALTREVYADIVAQILKFNGYPAGQAELSGRSEVLATIRMVAQKPGAAAENSPPVPMRLAGIGQGPRFAAYVVAPDLVSQGLMQAAATPADPLAPNGYPNPYKADTGFFKLPAGRTMGSSSSVAVDSRGHVWVADRCGANSCAESTLDPVMEFDAQGNFIKAFGGGLFNFPHGFFIDRQDNIWVVDERIAGTRGGTVSKFDRDGKLLLTIGKPGVASTGTDGFSEPNAVLVTPQGTIFVSEGHTANKVSRIMKFDAKGRFLKQWGTTGAGPGELNVPHALAMDSRGRLFVGDRWNNRIQIYDQEGRLLDSWTQFGRPSGLYVDRNDILYVTDSESRNPQGYGYNPGWRRGIRIGSARTGKVAAFIPDTEPNPDKGATSGAEGIWVDRAGVIYGAQVLQKAVVRYTK